MALGRLRANSGSRSVRIHLDWERPGHGEGSRGLGYALLQAVRAMGCPETGTGEDFLDDPLLFVATELRIRGHWATW